MDIPKDEIELDTTAVIALPADPYHGNPDKIIQAMTAAKQRFYFRHGSVDGPNRYYLGYYEKRALEFSMRRFATIRDPSLAGRRMRYEDAQILTVDAYSYCEADRIE